MAAAGEPGGKGVLGACWEMRGKESGWKQLWLLETGELGWGLQQAGAVLCSPTHPHTSILPSCLCA